MIENYEILIDSNNGNSVSSCSKYIDDNMGATKDILLMSESEKVQSPMVTQSYLSQPCTDHVSYTQKQLIEATLQHSGEATLSPCPSLTNSRRSSITSLTSIESNENFIWNNEARKTLVDYNLEDLSI